MTWYYWETEDNCGKLQAGTDSEAIQKIQALNMPDLWIIYKEKDEKSMQIIWEISE